MEATVQVDIGNEIQVPKTPTMTVSVLDQWAADECLLIKQVLIGKPLAWTNNLD